MENQKNILDYDTVELDEAQDAVIIIDQTLLPGKIELIALHTAQEMWDAIYLLKVRGAQVDIAYSGKEGLELWTGYPDGAFNAIILDGNPVDMDFLEFTDMFRSQVRRSAATMPILVLADGVSQDVVVESMRFGINAILPSDPELERLVLVLKAVTEK